MYTELKTKLDDAITLRSKADDKFQRFVAEEIASLRNAIRHEEQVRVVAAALDPRCIHHWWLLPAASSLLLLLLLLCALRSGPRARRR